MAVNQTRRPSRLAKANVPVVVPGVRSVYGPPAVGTLYVSNATSASAGASASVVWMNSVEPSLESASGPNTSGTVLGVPGVSRRIDPSARRSKKSCWPSLSPVPEIFSELTKTTWSPLSLWAMNVTPNAPFPAEICRSAPLRRRSYRSP